MKGLYGKSKIGFTVMWIVAYCVLMSLGDNLSEAVGISKVVSLPVSALLSAVLLLFIKRNGLMEKYGFCKPKVSASQMLFYIPVILLLTANLWHGVTFNLSAAETVLYILTMFFVGFLEETIFRGLLFNAMAENGFKSAVIVSSITFGIGHIINLVNGSGAELIPNLLQVIYAIGAGFMFVMIYCKTKSLIPCIVTHGLFNALSVFADESTLTLQSRIISCILIALISGGYALYIALSIKKENKQDCA